MGVTRYDYEKLAEKALSGDSTQEDINALGEWFEQYGDRYWNGIFYGSMDDNFHLYPIVKEVGDGIFETVGYELRIYS